MVQMNDVRMVYGNTEAEALSGVSFTINEGEFVFLVGPSGSGKTTIIKLITGELSPTSGQITVNGFDMQGIKRRKLPKLRRTLGVIFQDFRLIDKMTVYENVAFAMRVVGASNKEIRRRVPQVLELVGHPVGGVCPFAIENETVKTYLDVSMKRFETVFPAAGSGNSAIELTCAELEDYSGAAGWVDVCKGWEETSV